MELGDARVSGGEHLFVTAAADLADGVGGQFVGQGVHPFPPRPEVVQGVGGFDPLYRTPQPALKSMAMIVDEPGSQRFSGQTLASLRGTDIHYPSVLERYADSALRPISVEDQIRDQGAPHDVRREATRPARKPPQHKPETLLIHHRHLDPQSAGRRPRRVIARVGVADDAYAWVVEKHALEADRTFFCAVGEDLGAGVDGTTDADTASVMDRDPTGATGHVEHGVQNRPVRDGVGAVLHSFRLAVG